jgi:hypothetical protein
MKQSNSKKILIIGSIVFSAIALTTFFVIRRKRKKSGKSNSKNVDTTKNYIIGDSQTPLLDKNSIKAKKIGDDGNESNLWKGGKGLSWLKDAVDKYPIESDVNSIIINIGTNGGFNSKEDVSGLVNSIKQKFPNAKLFAVKGSWGWGGNKDVTESKVNAYYDKFKSEGVEIIEPAIGSTDNPHSNLPIYATIGAEIDRRLS